MVFKKTLSAVVLAGALAFGGCSKEAPHEYKEITGKVSQADQIELNYPEYGNIPITFLDIESESKKYYMVLAGPNNLKQGDSVDLSYLVDNEITAGEIWNRYFTVGQRPVFGGGLNTKYKADGYVTAWKKTTQQ